MFLSGIQLTSVLDPRQKHSGVTIRMINMNKQRAQSTLEFTFAMIVILFLMFGMVKILRWVGMDLAERRVAHDQTLTKPGATVEEQLKPDFYRGKRIDAVYHGTLAQ